jgi:hypothetical protein
LTELPETAKLQSLEVASGASIHLTAPKSGPEIPYGRLCDNYVYDPGVGQIIMKIYLLLFIMFASSVQAKPEELKVLKKACADALSTVDINVSSWNMFQYYERELLALEQSMIKKLSIEAQKDFVASMKSWRDYRQKYSKVESSFWAGGSGQRGIQTGTLIEVTKSKCNTLRSLVSSYPK